MEIKAYIESGAIESYVLGLASNEENAEIIRLRTIYPEINQAIDSFASDLELQITSSSVPPPAYIKNRIFQTLKQQNTFNSRMLHTEKDDQLQTPVIRIKQKNLTWKWMAAASFLLLMISSVFNFVLYNRYADKNEAYQTLLTEKQSLFAANQIYQTSQKEWELTTKMMADPAMVMITMKTAPGKKNKSATVFWDSRNKDVYVMAKELPNPALGKQMQLWAIVDGKPVDAGMIDPNCTSICKMKNIPRAQAFAITLEKQGGNPSPTMDQLLVMGAI